MTIHGLRYFDDAGHEGYFDTPDDPYYLGEQQSKVGNALFNSNTGIRWYYYLHEQRYGNVELKFALGCRALVDISRHYVIVVGENPPTICWPRNAAVWKEDGTLDHIIDLPNIVHDFGDGPRAFAAEGFRGVHQDECDIVLSVYFNFEWFQNRVYDIATKKWGRIIGSGRV